jgi:hypothetical protein
MSQFKHKLSQVIHEMFPVNDDTESHKGFMEYGVVCQHDTGFMCKCRAEHVAKVVEELLDKMMGK